MTTTRMTMMTVIRHDNDDKVDEDDNDNGHKT